MEKLFYINIVDDFTDTPGARYYDDGDFSGQEFREKFILPNFNKYEKIKINLDGTEGYATSFLEEAFGGTARIFGIEKTKEKFEFISNEEPDLLEEIKEYILDAKNKKKS